MVSFFTPDGDAMIPEPIARSSWGGGHLGGPAVCGLMAREVERYCPEGFVPARMTADLFRPVRDLPITVQSEVVRTGRRITVADARIVQDGAVRARSTVVFLSTGAPPPGQLWRPERELPVPPVGIVPPEGGPPLFRSGASEWSGEYADHQNAERKISWHAIPALVAGEKLTPFQHAAMVGDTANHICHWGSADAAYINADMTLTLSRLPIGFELGLRAEDSLASDGVSIGTATMYDRIGPLGTCVVSSLSNADQLIHHNAPGAE
ncbi:thioesterase family protein [Nocardia harenae]|uniref:thioesterase family protein n=1 Tax=Nocardia harenae TaxID=358707 RepID=UPI00082F5E15|nr:thioesterase family protein [Nocardia harenae]